MILSQEDHKYFGRGGLKARGGVDPALIKWLLNLSTPSCSVLNILDSVLQLSSILQVLECIQNKAEMER